MSLARKITVYKNIGCLVGVTDKVKTCFRGREMDNLDCIANAFLITTGSEITAFGSMDSLRTVLNDMFRESSEYNETDIGGRWIFPAFCDSHTHLVYAGSREKEFADRIKGLTYEQIAARGGGILNSAKRLEKATEEELYQSALQRLNEVIGKGTGAVEIKSGYGLSTETELKMLRVIRRLKEGSRAIIKATFLGAHAVPEKYRNNKKGYVDLICNEMIPEVCRENLADFVDVFCDRGYFTCDDTVKILDKAMEYGLRGKIHADELALSGGTRVAVEKGALSVDHLERIGSEEIDLLSQSSTLPTVLPGASFFLGMPYAPARRMIDSGLPVAIASDYNPGSSPSGDMRFMASLGCIKMKITPVEAIAATTLNGAAAMDISHLIGSIAVGKKASFFITEALPSLDFLLYAYTTPLVRSVVLQGQKQL